MMIGICDDEQSFADIFSSKVRAYMNKKGQSDYELRIYTDSTDLLESITEMDILFLDIEMGEKDSGIQIKKSISSLETDVRIVFVTSHYEMSEAAFGRNVYAFLQKKDIETRFESVMDEVLKDFDYDRMELEDVNGIIRCIRSSQIKYIEVFDKYTIVYLKDEKLTFRQPLKEWWKQLPAGPFGRASRYCIVNFSYLCGSVFKWNLTIDGKALDVTKSRRHAFKEAYQEYMRKR